MCDNYRINVRGLETFLSREEWSELEEPKVLRRMPIPAQSSPAERPVEDSRGLGQGRD